MNVMTRLPQTVLVALLAALALADDAEIDRLVKLSVTGRRAEAAARLRELGPAAVPRLVQLLGSGDSNVRAMALGCLQHAWSDAAVEPVTAAARDPNADIRKLAIHVLALHLSPDRLAAALAPLAADRNVRIAGPALAMIEHHAPDADRMVIAAAKPLLWPFVAEHLPRYHDPRLTPSTLAMLTSDSVDLRCHAISALIQQFAAEPRVRRRVALLLAAALPPRVRDRAAEYLRWHGTMDERDAITEALAREQDPWARASLAAAEAAVRTRDERGLSLSRELLADRSFTPTWRSTHPREDHPTDAMTQQAAALRRMAGYDVEPLDPPDDAPVAERWLAPVRDYFDDQRRSFGVVVDLADAGAFQGLVHLGDDAAWRREHETVVAVADGIVRYAGEARRSWGGLVIIEHRLPDDRRLCSLYGHLGPLIAVRVGQTVEAGQKLGALGRSLTWENGGYLAHLHLALREGPFGDGAWISGYMTPLAFERNDHGWLDPQAFLREHVTGP